MLSETQGCVGRCQEHSPVRAVAMFHALLTSVSMICLSAATPAEGHDPFLGAVPVVKYSFEANEDRDFDGQPDDWTRRGGSSDFPRYVESSIDRRMGHKSAQSFLFRLNGGKAAAYSPASDVDEKYSYVFEGYIRPQQLTHGAAMISISLLNGRRERIQRILSTPVAGTHHGWVKVRIGPIHPPPEVRYVVIGCHVETGRTKDLVGSVRFDELRLGRLPQLKINSNHFSLFNEQEAPLVMRWQVSGLEPDRTYRLKLLLRGVEGETVAETTATLTSGRKKEGEKDREFRDEWKLSAPGHGYYEVEAALEENKTTILIDRTSVAVLDPLPTRERGEFGWIVTEEQSEKTNRELVEIAAQGGINWIKYPLWSSARKTRTDLRTDLVEMLEKLKLRNVTPVGLLNHPPAEIRGKFRKDWGGIGDIFGMPPQFWTPSLEPVMARYSSSVQYWQLGSDEDLSFLGQANLPQTIDTIKQEFDRIGRDTRVGIPWEWERAPPERLRPSRSFLTWQVPAKVDDASIGKELGVKKTEVPRWCVVEPGRRGKRTGEQFGGDFVRRLTLARAHGADVVFAPNLFDAESGLLTESGAPRQLFLPWRTLATSLQGAVYLGRFDLTGESENHVFVRDDEAIMVVWNTKPTVETLCFGGDAVVFDIWGRQKGATPTNGQPFTFQTGPIPRIVRGGSAGLVRWQMAARFETGKLASRHGRQSDAILGVNTLPQGISGKVSLVAPSDWGIEPGSWSLQVGAGENYRLPVLITLPSGASLGEIKLPLDFEITTDRVYRFRVHRAMQIGLGDVDLQVVDRLHPDGRLEISQTVLNRTSPAETLNMRCTLFVPGGQRQRQMVTRLKQGKDRKLYFLPDGASLRGRTLRIRVEQMDGPRVLNYQWKVGENWDKAQ